MWASSGPQSDLRQHLLHDLGMVCHAQRQQLLALRCTQCFLICACAALSASVQDARMWLTLIASHSNFCCCLLAADS